MSIFEGRDSFETTGFICGVGAAFVSTAAIISASVANSRCTKIETRVTSIEGELGRTQSSLDQLDRAIEREALDRL